MIFINSSGTAGGVAAGTGKEPGPEETEGAPVPVAMNELEAVLDPADAAGGAPESKYEGAESTDTALLGAIDVFGAGTATESGVGVPLPRAGAAGEITGGAPFVLG